MTYSRRYNRPKARWMDLKYAGTCSGPCGRDLPVGSRAFYDPRDRTVTCTDLACAKANGITEDKWIGSPVSGQYVTVLSVTRLNSGAVLTRNSRGLCEDAPCCGCCS